MESNTFQDFLRNNSIPLPTQPIEQGKFIRFGKKGCYSAKAIGEGIYIRDFKEGKDFYWFPKNIVSLNSEEIKDRQNNINKFREEAEIERQKSYEKAAEEAGILWEKLQNIGESNYLKYKQVLGYGIRYGEGFLAIPIRDIQGKLWSIQRIYDETHLPSYLIKQNRNKDFLKGGKTLGHFHLIGNLSQATKIFICEGYATGVSVYTAVNEPVVIAFYAANLIHVVGSIRSVYPNLKIIIAGDNDQWKEPNTGKLKAEETAAKYNCEVVLPYFSQESMILGENQGMKPTDFNDLYVLNGLEEVKKQVCQAKEEIFDKILPLGFTLNEKGLFFKENWVCSPIEVLAYSRNENSEDWGRLIQFADSDGHIHKFSIAMELLAGDCNEFYALLLSKGFHFNPQRSFKNKLLVYLQQIKVEQRVQCISRIGWYGNYFVLPNEVIPYSKEICLQTENHNFAGFKKSGTLEQWQQKVALPCRNNSRLIFALACAFAAPMLPLIKAESGGFNFKGASSIGKSTALMVAASVWGGDKYIQQWKATGNALEAVAEAYNNTLLCLDELGQIDGKEAGEIIYMLANGAGKNRLKAKGGLRKKAEWNLLILSTGEISLTDKVNEAGKRTQAGMLNRMVDIPADAGKGYRLFETLNGYQDGNLLANDLKENSRKYFGTAICAFIPHLINFREELSAVIKDIQNDFLKENISSSADGQIKRVAQRFGLVAAAGELAIKLNILPFDLGQALRATRQCFQAWIDDRGTTEGYEIEEGIKQVQAFFEAHHSSRFALMDSDKNFLPEQKIINQVGFKRKTQGDVYEFFVFPQIFIKEICKGFSHQEICKELVARGFLIRGGENQFVKNQRLPGTGQKKIYHFTPRILGEVEL